MSSVSELALKGHFELLKKQYGSKNDAPKDVLKVMGKAISMAEDLFEHDKSFFTEEHKEDYRFMVKTLNSYGNSYKGHPDLMVDGEAAPVFDKKPMQKAGKKQEKKDQQKKAG